jgi:exonuclease III
LGSYKKFFMDRVKQDYRCYLNSTMNKRGVAILIEKKLDFNPVIHFTDSDENIILIKGKLLDCELLIGSVYGPNKDSKGFFENLEMGIKTSDCDTVIVGGDFNATPSMLPVGLNPDVYRMTNVPSLVRSRWLNEVCNNCNIIDIYRVVNKDCNDYTHIPHGESKKNRSRIDFFLQVLT